MNRQKEMIARYSSVGADERQSSLVCANDSISEKYEKSNLLKQYP